MHLSKQKHLNELFRNNIYFNNYFDEQLVQIQSYEILIIFMIASVI